MQKRILSYDIGDPICALATPWGTSALAVIRTSGEGSIERLSKIFSNPDSLKNSTGWRLHHGFIMSNGVSLDEVVIAVFRAPHSYTGEDSAEIYCHGSLPGIRSILEALRSIGFRPAEPGEFTYRAFIHGKMDLTRAEAVHEIVTAKNPRRPTCWPCTASRGALEKNPAEHSLHSSRFPDSARNPTRLPRGGCALCPDSARFDPELHCLHRSSPSNLSRGKTVPGGRTDRVGRKNQCRQIQPVQSFPSGRTIHRF